ncbi:MAG TPA: hypothetical protein VGF25_12780 [Thermoleophilaceae bacterium]|jgi:hypothetical protein
MEGAGTLVFMAAVTCYLLGRVFAEVATGAPGALEVAVYGLTAAFGLDFLVASWRSLWTRS